MRDVDMKALCTSSLFQILEGVSNTQLPWKTNNGPTKIEKTNWEVKLNPTGKEWLTFSAINKTLHV